MPYLKLPVSTFNPTSMRRQVDPDEVNANFREIARLVNGNLGIENLAGGRGVDNAMLEFPRSIQAVSIGVRTGLGTWPTDGQLLKVRADARLVGIGVFLPINFTATLKAAGSTVATLAPPGAASYFIENITSPEIASGSVIALNVTGGSCREITLWLTFEHTS